MRVCVCVCVSVCVHEGAHPARELRAARSRHRIGVPRGGRPSLARPQRRRYLRQPSARTSAERDAVTPHRDRTTDATRAGTRRLGHGDANTATPTRRLARPWTAAAPTSRTRATCAPRARARTGGGGGRGGAGAGAGGRRAVCRVTGTSTTQRVLSRARARSRELVCRVAGGTCGAVDKVYRVAVGARRGAGAKAVGVGGQAAFVGSPGRGPSEQACRRKSVWCVVGGVRNRRQLLIYGVS